MCKETPKKKTDKYNQELYQARLELGVTETFMSNWLDNCCHSYYIKMEHTNKKLNQQFRNKFRLGVIDIQQAITNKQLKTVDASMIDFLTNEITTTNISKRKMRKLITDPNEFDHMIEFFEAKDLIDAGLKQIIANEKDYANWKAVVLKAVQLQKAKSAQDNYSKQSESGFLPRERLTVPNDVATSDKALQNATHINENPDSCNKTLQYATHDATQVNQYKALEFRVNNPNVVKPMLVKPDNANIGFPRGDNIIDTSELKIEDKDNREIYRMNISKLQPLHAYTRHYEYLENYKGSGMTSYDEDGVPVKTTIDVWSECNPTYRIIHETDNVNQDYNYIRITYIDLNEFDECMEEI